MTLSGIGNTLLEIPQTQQLPTLNSVTNLFTSPIQPPVSTNLTQPPVLTGPTQPTRVPTTISTSTSQTMTDPDTGPRWLILPTPKMVRSYGPLWISHNDREGASRTVLLRSIIGHDIPVKAIWRNLQGYNALVIHQARARVGTGRTGTDILVLFDRANTANAFYTDTQRHPFRIDNFQFTSIANPNPSLRHEASVKPWVDENDGDHMDLQN